jgi:hypothetical protein
VAKLLAELLGWLFLPSMDLASIDDNIVFVSLSIDVYGTKLKWAEPHFSPLY